MTTFDAARSEKLHARVRAFVSGSAAASEETFDVLACDLTRHQAQSKTGIERLLDARGVAAESLTRAAQIPAVPTDAFKVRRVACHPPDQDCVVFRTSGTTVGTRGQHPMRTIETYRMAACQWAKHMLFPDVSRAHLVFLARPYQAMRDSSLGCMFAMWEKPFGLSTSWALHDGSLRTETVLEARQRAISDGAPVLIAGASFSFVALIDQLGARGLRLPPGSRAMQTGGFKGKTREVSATTMRAAISKCFGLDPALIVGEYGMTELSSQAYEATIRCAFGFATDGASPPSSAPGLPIYVSPPWMRVSAVDPVALEPVAPGTVGIARVEDLANVDSAVVVQTADRVREVEGGFELHGRHPGAVPRGCSLGVAELLDGS